MYFIAIACVINIVLDYLFMGAFHMGAAGAALGTTLSQVVSVVISLCYDSQTENGDCSEKAGFSTAESKLWDRFCTSVSQSHFRMDLSRSPFMVITIIANRRGLKPGGSRRHCGKDHRFSVSCAILDAFLRVGTGGTEYRCRKARPCQRDASLRPADRRWIRYFYRNSDSVYRITGRWTVYIRSDCDRIWKPVHTRLYF